MAQFKGGPSGATGRNSHVSLIGQQNKNSLDRGSVVQQINRIIYRAIDEGVSDIHFEIYEEYFRVRYRLDGVLQKVGELAIGQKDAIISRIKIMADLDIAEKRRPQDGRIRIDHKDYSVDVRVSTLPTDFGEKVVLRILDKGNQSLQLEALGFEEANLASFRRAIRYPYGMILVTGPTGSGKTTTLYSALNELNSEEVNITTIEDPIEYNLEGINQMHVRSDIGLDFSQALRSILRQDPNIIMVGEIRDRKTAEIAIRAALTGHLVFSTLHTNDAPSAVTRLLDMGIEPFLVASSVRLIMAQRLVRKICTSCKTQQSPDPDLMEQLNMRQEPIAIGEGCETCNTRGYLGRIALIELLEMDSRLRELINDRSGASKVKQVAEKGGMTTLREAGIAKIKEGITTPSEVLRETRL